MFDVKKRPSGNNSTGPKADQHSNDMPLPHPSCLSGLLNKIRLETQLRTDPRNIILFSTEDHGNI